jgi:uncharacterized protein YcaQ
VPAKPRPDPAQLGAGSAATIGHAEARAIAVAAQGFDRARSIEPPGADEIVALVQRIGALQLDSINVFCRSHYLPVFARLGPYDRSILDGLAAHGADPAVRRLGEYWAHEMSLIPFETFRLLRWRNARVDREFYRPVVTLARERPELVEQVLALIDEHGPIRAGAAGRADGIAERRPAEMFSWREGKMALEYLFFAGKVTTAGRVRFERLYDLPARVLPAELLDLPPLLDEEAQRELVRIAARALGIATMRDLADYFRMTRADTADRVAELEQAGELVVVAVEGRAEPAYLLPSAAASGACTVAGARALLSPFDSLIWTRDRTQRLFDFAYHVEIYTAAAKREYGYYVLPFLLGDRLVARVDLKADRAGGRLLVQGAFQEPDCDLDEVGSALAGELRAVAGWLGLTEVTIGERGDLVRPLEREFR